MGTYQRAIQLMAILKDHDVRAVADPRSAHPPCVLIPPPTRTYDLGSGYSVTWRLVCLAPGPGNADAWVELDKLADTVVEALEPSDTTVESASYQLPTGSPEPHPAFIITWTEGTDL